MTGADLDSARRAYVRALAKLKSRVVEAKAAAEEAGAADVELAKEISKLRDNVPESASGERAMEALDELSWPDADDHINGLREVLDEITRDLRTLEGNAWDEAIALVGRAR